MDWEFYMEQWSNMAGWTSLMTGVEYTKCPIVLPSYGRFKYFSFIK